MINESIRKLMLYCLLFSHFHASGYTGVHQDQTSPRLNTLSDDADDIQRQLDNEARDRIKYGRPKTIWVFHFPNHLADPISMQISTEYRTRSLPDVALLKSALSNIQDTASTSLELPPINEPWDYESQTKWFETYPECGGRFQSPVDLPVDVLVKAKGARKLKFGNYNVMPRTLTLMNDGERVILFGEWPKKHQPLVYGGGAHSRRYVFHSLTLHWPSEHFVGGLQYPMESQAIHISADYNSLKEAIQASHRDPQAFLGISNIYKFANETQNGLAYLINHAIDMGITNKSIDRKPLSFFNPPFKEYVCYHGSLPTPPCTESVLWLVRGRTLSVVREVVEASTGILSSNTIPQKHFTRQPQPLNDRKVYIFS